MASRPFELGVGEEVVVSADSGTITIQLLPPTSSGLLQPAIYGPAIPGVIVALAGLLIAHALTKRRERRKEVAELCANLKKLADEAAIAAVNAWSAEVGEKRKEAVRDVKRRIQALGIAATQVNRRTRHRIDVTSRVSAFRKAATKDPFEDQERPATDAAEGPILHELSAFLRELDEKHDHHYR